MQSPETDFRKLRESAGLSLEEVAVRTTYTVRTVQRWERGESVPRKPVIEMLQDIAQERFEAQEMQPNAFTFIDLFAGIGGMRKGFESVGGECVATCEWNKYARETYAANFETANHPFFWDIQEIPAKNFPRHDVLLAGFPCQPFSIAGVSKKNALGMPHGFKCADQGNLFFDIVRILEHHRPAAFLLENVKNLVSHDGGLTFKVIIDTLREGLGYTVDWKVIDAKAFVPQHRERTFIVGTRKDTGFRFKDIPIPDPAKGPKMKSILHPDSEVDSKYTLTPKLWKYLQDYAAKHRAAGNGFGYGLVGPLDQEVDAGAAGLLPFTADLVGDALGGVGVPLAFQLVEELVEPLRLGGEGAGRWIDGSLVRRLRKRDGRHRAGEGEGKKECGKHEKAHGGYGKPPWPNFKSLFVDHHFPRCGKATTTPYQP